jgi:Bcr/CflA subfamily drug resistance transporter
MASNRFLFINIILIACLTSMATDIYTPSLAALAEVMHAPLEKVKFSLTIFMVGLSLSQLFYGPLSEGTGRRAPLLVGLLIFMGGSIICTFANTIQTLIIGRFVQGLGAGACSALWRTIFRDKYQGEALVTYGAWLSVVIILVMPAVPILGGYFQHYLSWRANFIFLTLYSALTCFFIFLLFEETSEHHHRDRLKKIFVLQAFKQLFTSRIFMGYTLAVFFCYGAFFSWFALGPVLLIKYVGLNPVEFGWVSFAIGAGAMIFGGIINRHYVKIFGEKYMMRTGWVLMLLSGFLLLLGEALFSLNLYAITLPVFLFFFGSAFIWPNAFAGAFTPFGHIAGYAGSLYSFMQLGGGAIIGSIVAYMPASSPFPLAIVFIISASFAWISYESMVKPA